MVQFVEEFYSLQGEGRYYGTPSFFFRFGRCNMQCRGFDSKFLTDEGTIVVGCDSVYAVDKENFSSSWKSVDAQFLIEVLKSNQKKYPNVRDIVITGGEPMLYAKDEEFLSFLKFAKSQDFRITIETNGTLDVDFETLPIYKNIIFALSIKLSNSGEPKSKRVKKDVIKNIVLNANETFFKFSLKDSLLKESLQEIQEIEAIAKAEVYCMAVCQNSEELLRQEKAITQFCLENGYTYSDRLHIRLYDGKRGV